MELTPAQLANLALGRLPKHGHSRGPRGARVKSLTYNSWRKMKERCMNPAAVQYKYYGARGVRVCASWHSFATFLADMGLRPSKQHRLCRRGDVGNYTPANCVWATAADNARRLI